MIKGSEADVDAALVAASVTSTSAHPDRLDRRSMPNDRDCRRSQVEAAKPLKAAHMIFGESLTKRSEEVGGLLGRSIPW